MPVPPTSPGEAPARGPVLWPYFVTTFLVCSAGGLVFPLLADLQDAHGLPTWGLGAISALYFAGAVGGQLVLAPLADRGHARTLLLAGVGLAVAAMVGFAVAGVLWQFCLARLLSGLAAGSFLPATRATLVRTDPDRAGHLLGRYAGTETGGFVFGPVVGTAVYAVAGLAMPFVVLAIALAAGAVLLLRTPVPAAATVDDPAVGPGRDVTADDGAAAGSYGPFSSFGLLRHRGVVVAVLLELAVFLPVGIYDSLWARYLQDRGASTLLVGVGLSLYGIPYVLWAPRGGRLADRLGPVRSATIGLLVVVPTTFVYGLLAGPLVITGVALVEAFGNATAVPGAQTAMARSCPPRRLAAGQGLSGAISLMTAGATAALAAPVYETAGPVVLFSAAAVAMAMLATVAHLVDRKGGTRAVPGPLVAVTDLPASAPGPRVEPAM